MKTYLETDRLILREIVPEDVDGMFELDSDHEVHKYLGNNPVKNKEEARKNIDLIRQQYIENKIGRWAVVERSSNQFIGWAGLKLIKETINNHIDYYDLGYRLIKNSGDGVMQQKLQKQHSHTILTNSIYQRFLLSQIATTQAQIKY